MASCADDLIKRAIERERQRTPEKDALLETYKRMAITESSSLWARELMDTGLIWNIRKVWELHSKRNIEELEKQLTTCRGRLEHYNFKGDSKNWRRKQKQRLYAPVLEEFGNVLAARLLIDQFERRKKVGIDDYEAWATSNDYAPSGIKKDWKYYYDTLTQREAESKYKAAQERKKARLREPGRTNETKRAGEFDPYVPSTQEVETDDTLAPRAGWRAELGHWEFENSTEQTIAQGLLGKYIGDNEDITPENVHQVQQAFPGSFHVRLVWIIDQPESNNEGESELSRQHEDGWSSENDRGLEPDTISSPVAAERESDASSKTYKSGESTEGGRLQDGAGTHIFKDEEPKSIVVLPMGPQWNSNTDKSKKRKAEDTNEEIPVSDELGKQTRPIKSRRAKSARLIKTQDAEIEDLRTQIRGTYGQLFMKEIYAGTDIFSITPAPASIAATTETNHNYPFIDD